MSSTHSKNEETLAVIIEEINKKLDEEIKIRKAMQKEQEQKTKAILQKLSKLQEYNEINDMRAIFMSKQIQNILEKLYYSSIQKKEFKENILSLQIFL